MFLRLIGTFILIGLNAGFLSLATASTSNLHNSLNQSAPQIQTLTAICPPQPGTSELTFARVMMNFGRMTIKADSWTREMSQSGTSREKPEAAAQDLALAVACAQVAVEAAQAAVNENAAGQEISSAVAVLMPGGIRKHSGNSLTEYLDSYERMMFGFQTLLEKYHLQVLASDFEGGFATSQKVRNFADHAHDKLNTSTFCEKALRR